MTSALDRFRLDGQVAVITGGARGIGRATAEAFVAAGARAVLVDRDLAEAKSAARRSAMPRRMRSTSPRRPRSTASSTRWWRAPAGSTSW